METRKKLFENLSFTTELAARNFYNGRPLYMYIVARSAGNKLNSLSQ